MKIFGAENAKAIAISAVIGGMATFGLSAYDVHEKANDDVEYLSALLTEGLTRAFKEVSDLEKLSLSDGLCTEEDIRALQSFHLAEGSKAIPVIKASQVSPNVYCSPFREIVIPQYIANTRHTEIVNSDVWQVGFVNDAVVHDGQARLFVTNGKQGFLYTIHNDYNVFEGTNGARAFGDLNVFYHGVSVYTIDGADNDLNTRLSTPLYTLSSNSYNDAESELFTVSQDITVALVWEKFEDFVPMFFLFWAVFFGFLSQYFQFRSSNKGIDFINAIANGEFVPYYQPIVNVSSRKIVGVEMLARWVKPDGKVVMPGQFIEEMEKNGTIIQATQSMLATAIEELKPFFEYSETFYCSVNITALHLENDDFYGFMRKRSTKHSNFALELTERQPIRDLNRARQRINKLKSLGMSISLDDAGTGYGGNSYLQVLPIDTVKIDRMFVATLRKGEDSKVIDSYIRMCKSLGVKIIAEGVETKEESMNLLLRGVPIHQGFYYGKGMSINELIKWAGEQCQKRKRDEIAPPSVPIITQDELNILLE